MTEVGRGNELNSLLPGEIIFWSLEQFFCTFPATFPNVYITCISFVQRALRHLATYQFLCEHETYINPL